MIFVSALLELLHAYCMAVGTLGPPDLMDSRGPWSSGCLMEAVVCLVWF